MQGLKSFVILLILKTLKKTIACFMHSFKSIIHLFLSNKHFFKVTQTSRPILRFLFKAKKHERFKNFIKNP